MSFALPVLRSRSLRPRPLPRGAAFPFALLGALSLAGGCSPDAKDDSGSGEEDSGYRPVTWTEHCGAVEGDETWSTAENPHRITCEVTVTGQLTLEPGLEVALDAGAALRVQGGTLLAEGEPHLPIALYSAEDTPGDGDHGGIISEDGTVSLHEVTVRHGGSEGGIVHLEGGEADVRELTVSNGPSHGLWAEGTTFTDLSQISAAYVPVPVAIPWTAASAMDAVELDSVDTEAVVLHEETLAGAATLPALNLPWYSEGVSVVEGGSLEVEEGALLRLAGDLQVDGGGLVVWGEDGDPARIEAAEGTAPQVAVGSTATSFSCRYAAFSGLSLLSETDLLFFQDNEVASAPGVGLSVSGGIKDDEPDNLSGNTFAGDDAGLEVRWQDLSAVGENDYTGSAFDGVAVTGTTLEEDLSLDALPSDEVWVRGDLTVAGGTLALTGGGTFRFDDAATLTVDGGVLSAEGMGFEHLEDTPGGWYGIEVAAGSDDTVLENCDIAHGGQGGGANVRLSAAATIRDSTLRDSAGWGLLVAEDVSPTLEDNTYANNALGDEGSF